MLAGIDELRQRMDRRRTSRNGGGSSSSRRLGTSSEEPPGGGPGIPRGEGGGVPEPVPSSSWRNAGTVAQGKRQPVSGGAPAIAIRMPGTGAETG